MDAHRSAHIMKMIKVQEEADHKAIIQEQAKYRKKRKMVALARQNRHSSSTQLDAEIELDQVFMSLEDQSPRKHRREQLYDPP